MRADQMLVERGLAASRAQAKRLIAAGVQWRAAHEPLWRAVAKNRDELPAGALLQLLQADEARYVSRGGLKLEGALRHLGLDVRGLHVLDVGQSTGGFTDCLLQHGAAQVLGVDVGHGQLHARLRSDARVVCIERTNARDALALQTALAPWAEPALTLLVGDLSFISQTLVLPALLPWLAPGSPVLMLVKPQFELQPHQVGKGVVKDPALYAVVEQRLRTCYTELGLQVLHWLESPIQGGDGNREFFIHARKP